MLGGNASTSKLMSWHSAASLDEPEHGCHHIIETRTSINLVSRSSSQQWLDGLQQAQYTSGPGEPPIPHEVIRALIDHYLGPRRRAGQGFATPPADRYEDALVRTRFGVPRQIFCPGQPDIVQDIDGVLANYFSTSFAAPHLFGDRRPQFEADLRAELAARSPSGLFWDWPGDTVILLANKPKE